MIPSSPSWLRSALETPALLPREKAVLRLPAGFHWEGFLNSVIPVSLYTHFVDQRTTPCVGLDQQCRHCPQGADRKLKAYVGFYNLTIRKHHVLELTESALCELGRAGFIAADTGTLGLWFGCQRRTANQRSEMMITYNRDRRASFKLPPPIDLVHAVTRLYGLAK